MTLAYETAGIVLRPKHSECDLIQRLGRGEGSTSTVVVPPPSAGALPDGNTRTKVGTRTTHLGIVQCISTM